MTEETTTEQLAEIERQAADTAATEYTPPDGWRVVAVGEVLQEGDMWVWPTDDQLRQTVHIGAVVGANQRYIRRTEPQPEPQQYTPPEGWRVVRFGEQLLPGDVWVNEDGTEQRSNILHWDAAAVSGGRCIRRIKPEAQPQPVQVREGRWRTRNGEIKNIRPCEPLRGAYYVWPWTDGFMTYQDNGLHQGSKESPNDLVEYLGPIEKQPEPEPDADERIRELKECNSRQAEQIEELRSEVSYVQNLLGTERRRVAELEELVGSLRTINVTQEKAFEAAGKENTALRNQLTAAKAELASVAADRQQLRVELDAAQQVPADSPELRQLWADLAEVAHDRDTYKHAHELLVQDIDATHQQTKAMTVEAICEWIEPIRREDPHLRAVILFHLPKIMRSLAGLNSSEDVD